jgi:hypothetical protein
MSLFFPFSLFRSANETGIHDSERIVTIPFLSLVCKVCSVITSVIDVNSREVNGKVTSGQNKPRGRVERDTERPATAATGKGRARALVITTNTSIS